MNPIFLFSRRTAKSLVTSILLIGLMATSAFAQQRGQGGRGGRGGFGGPGGRGGASSPSVAEDGKVTFRLRAPEAKTVTVSGDFGDAAELTKDENGVWSVTVGPLEPELYVYSFDVDGVKVIDPSNARAKIGFTTSTIMSILEVPTEEPAFYDVQKVPHGEVRIHLYDSKSNGVTRELNVYVPPGYDENPDKRYPVLYLLHGANNDQHSWHRYGRANDILDNLLANDEIVPFIVVMPLGYAGALVNGDGTGIPSTGGGRGEFGGGGLYERDILEDIIPLVESKYRTIADRNHRAIVGFSMGGGQSLGIGLGNLDTFSYVGGMSAAIFGDPAQMFSNLTEDVDKTNEQIALLWFACGDEDSLFDRSENLDDFLTKNGIEHTYLATEGAHHWRVWRHYLQDLAPLLFK